MGTFMGHLAPGLAFTLLGLWHTHSTIKSYKQTGPTGFTSRPWFPLPTSISALKHLELYLILSFSVLAVAAQFLDPTFSFAPDRLEHATMFLHLAVYASATLAAELTSSSDAFAGLVGALAASVFAQELFLLHFHSTDHTGLEGHYHWLLQLAVVVSLFATVAATGLPASFPAAVVRSASVLLQGLLFVDMGFVLWVPKLVPEGCYSTDGVAHGAVACWTEGASRRAAALANLQFSWMIAGVSVLISIMCLWPDRKCMEYRKLQSRGVDVVRVSGGDDGGVAGV